MIYVPSFGPKDARIALVGEAPGAEEERLGLPFQGSAGYCLDKMLEEAGIARSDCFVTNVVRFRPQNNDIEQWISPRPKSGFVPLNGAYVAPFVLDHLKDLEAELTAVRPNIVVALGGIPLWALVNHNSLAGVTTWRGYLTLGRTTERKILVTYHPSYILRSWADRADVVQDFRRVKQESKTPSLFQPSYAFRTRPSFDQVINDLYEVESFLNLKPLRLSLDIETRKKHIACMGLAWSRKHALCIPFMDIHEPDGYWSEDEELVIVLYLRNIMTHPNAQIVGQNLHYDSQYWAKHWGVVPSVYLDTTVAHHVCFPSQAKALDYLVPRYCEHPRRWKADGKEWHLKMNEDVLWRYNCMDCVYTYEISEVLETVLDRMGLRPQFEFQQRKLWRQTLNMMLRGVRIDLEKRSTLDRELGEAIARENQFISTIAGHPLNTNSHVQMKKFLYDDLKLPPIYSRATDNLTANDEALERCARREPLLKPLIESVQKVRSMRVFRSTFVEASLDTDQRMRCSYNQCGTRTFRFSSSESAFYTGTNLQNLPRVGSNGLPNIRSLFIPDPGFVLMDWDLMRADVQVVAWESNDELLKQQLREGIDLHSFHASELKTDRYRAKVWVHGTNYGGRPRTMAATCGITVHEAERLRTRYFQLRPGILDWHKRIESQLAATGTISNAFGYRIRFFDRPEGILSEALAWIPQSTVGIVINKGLVNLSENLSYMCEILLQTHDSLTIQVHDRYFPSAVPVIRANLLITVPYPDPLIIPVDGKFSRRSFGELEAIPEILWEIRNEEAK